MNFNYLSCWFIYLKKAIQQPAPYRSLRNPFKRFNRFTGQQYTPALILVALSACLCGSPTLGHTTSSAVNSETLNSLQVRTTTEAGAIVILGDSISAGYGIKLEQGWVHLLGNALAEREKPWYAVNASISGETTSGGLARLAGVLNDHKPKIVVIELGGNDGLRGYPIKKIRSNLTAMISQIRAHQATPVLVAMRIPPNYGPRYTQAFDGVFAEVAQATGTLLVPFILEEVALTQGLIQDDGIHPTAAAQPLLLAAVWAYLESLL